MKLTEHFHAEEVVATSHRDINNEFPTTLATEIFHTASKMEEVRTLLCNCPIIVLSWYRSPKLNERIGGAKKSQHMKGEAVDFICPDYGTPAEICTKLANRKVELRIDQLIYEGTWVHVSFVIPPRVPRLEVLTLMLDKSYATGVVLKRS